MYYTHIPPHLRTIPPTISASNLDCRSPLDYSLLSALAMIEGITPSAVAKALPDFQFTPAVEARLLLSWDKEFAVDVLSAWTPSDTTWLQYLWRTVDDTQAMDLLLGALGVGETRRVISAAGQALESRRLVSIMKALRVALQQRGTGIPKLGEHSITPSSLALTPRVPFSNPV